ncbi:MAG TPA: polysaccharide deacetylase family protein [Clostridiales bacterium]|nr:polysaccharide deacetylase family protein [Clostridiales bacterium]HPP34852.1 polysaccharide deacetylase family protein [Clostridiales bacterium]
MKRAVRGLIIPVFLMFAGCVGEADVPRTVQVSAAEAGVPASEGSEDMAGIEAVSITDAQNTGSTGTETSNTAAGAVSTAYVNDSGTAEVETGAGGNSAADSGVAYGTATSTNGGTVADSMDEAGPEGKTDAETGSRDNAESGRPAAGGSASPTAGGSLDIVGKASDGQAAEGPVKTAGAGSEKPAEKHVKIPILLYHHFMKDNVPEDKYSTTVTETQFEDHIRTLTEKGYNSISLEDLRAYIEEGRALPPKPYMITVDDGYDSNYYIMYPILRKYNAKAVIFVTGNMITDEPGRRWKEDSLVWMTWDMLREMEDSGLVEIQNHGYLHKPADTMAPEEFMESVIRGEELLNEKLGERKIKAFAYPHGKATEDSRKFLEENGYKMQFMVRAGAAGKNSDMADLPRIIVSHGKTGTDVINMIRKY